MKIGDKEKQRRAMREASARPHRFPYVEIPGEREFFAGKEIDPGIIGTPEERLAILGPPLPKFDKHSYQRQYMRQRRAKAKTGEIA